MTPPKINAKDEILRRSFALVIGMLVIILNAIQVVLILRIKRKKTLYEKCLLSLSVADLLFGFSNGVVSMMYLVGIQNVIILYDITYTVFLFCILTSILHILWIALDRLWAVTFPFNHNVKATSRKLHKLIILSWTFTLLISVSVLTIQRIRYSSSQQSTSSNITNLTEAGSYFTNISAVLSTNTTGSQIQLVSLTPSVITKHLAPHTRNNQLERDVKLAISIMIIFADIVYITAYSYIIYGLRRNSKIQKDNRVNNHPNSERRMLIVCILVAMFFVLFTAPYAIYRISTGRTPMWAGALLVINSGMNSIVYFFRGRYQRVNIKYRQNQSPGSKSLELKNKCME